MTTTGATPDRRIYNPVQRDAATFLETSAESGGARTLIEIEVAPGGGNSPHRHVTYDERFDVVDGTLTVDVGGRTLRLGPGETATATAGTTHRFANETDATVVFRVTLTPGHEGFERAVQIAYGLAVDGRVRADGLPKSLVHAALLTDLADIRIDGPIGVVARLLAPLAWVARRAGVERRLTERYGL